MISAKFLFMSFYTLNYIMYGSIFIYLGALIPYYSEEAGVSESEFTILLMAKGIGYILGGFMKVKVLKNIDLHKGLILSNIGSGICSIMMAMTYHKLTLTFITFVSSICLYFTHILVNTAFMRRGSEDVKLYMTLSYISINLGCGLGPFLISYFGISACIILGGVVICFGIAYIFLPHFPDQI